MREINVKQLEEWGLDNLGDFIKARADVDNNTIKVVFKKTTLVLTIDEADDGELLATIFKEDTISKEATTNISLSDVDICTHEIELILTDGHKIRLAINYEDDCDDFGSYSNTSYTISLTI